MDTYTFTTPPEGVPRLDTFLVTCLPEFSRSRIQGLLENGFVTVNDVPILKSGYRAKGNEEVIVSIPPPVPAIPEPEDIPLDVIFEDEDVLVLNKSAGLVVHPAPGHFTGTLVNALLHHCPQLTGIGGVARPGIVHRLDQDTSGVMVVAKSERAMASLVHQFAAHTTLAKTYLALVHGIPVPHEGRIENLIGRSPYDRKKMAIVERAGKCAITNYRVVAQGMRSSVTAVECRIETGRTHQIRVHLASLGCPIIGDPVYGSPARDKKLTSLPNRQMLHAWHLTFCHPANGKPMTFTAPLPADIRTYLPDDWPLLRYREST